MNFVENYVTENFFYLFIFSLLYLLVYKSTSHFESQKSNFSSFRGKQMKLTPIKISQNVTLFFLRMYWKHGELRKAEV